LGEVVSPIQRFDYSELTDLKDWYLFDLLNESRAFALVTRDKKVIEYGEKYEYPVYGLNEIARKGILLPRNT
jgi:predicted nucleic acid-binding protein